VRGGVGKGLIRDDRNYVTFSREYLTWFLEVLK
jgi:hypothetical protein